MTDCTYQGGIESARGTGFFSSGLFVAIAGAVAAGALCLLPVLGAPRTILPEAACSALVVMLMTLGFAGVLLSTAAEFIGCATVDAEWCCSRPRFYVQDALR